MNPVSCRKDSTRLVKKRRAAPIDLTKGVAKDRDLIKSLREEALLKVLRGRNASALGAGLARGPGGRQDDPVGVGTGSYDSMRGLERRAPQDAMPRRRPSFAHGLSGRSRSSPACFVRGSGGALVQSRNALMCWGLAASP